ncbi:hypothetical protein GCM10010401_19740 [Rarobacter faecitabidus]|uniref:Leucine rich repeat variant domain-containing protein n=1 Tax=Rarobacter faecitabidus TaxID=13243 RepID=A0A542ZV46_RARFA|nr:hypothetical protein [Rarobacter faecitabidus]TQL64179.1 hypothetical protein FB461_0670 [Rarobacter faecitabidus]
MSQQFDPSSFTAAHAADPNTPLEVLAAIANQRPDLRVALASNPAAPADLVSWLQSTGDPAILTALAQRNASSAPAPSFGAQSSAPQPSTPQPPVAPQQPAAAQAPSAQPQSAPPSGTTPVQPVDTQPGYPSPPVQPAGYDQQGFAQPAPGPQGPVQPAFGQPEYGQAGATQQPGYGQPIPGQPGYGHPGYGNQVGPEGYGLGAGTAELPAPQKKSKAPLIVGLSVAGALVLGGGAYAGYKFFFDKSGGSATPTAATETLLDAAAKSDVRGVVGAISTVETDYASQISAAISRPLKEVDSLKSLTADLDPSSYADIVTLTTDGLKYSEKELIKDETSRVSLVGGTVTLDLDADKTVELFKKQQESIKKLSQSFSSLGGSSASGLDEAFGSADEQELRDEIDKNFPVKLTFTESGVTSETAAGEKEGTEDFAVSVVTVHEGGGWFVSPLLTIADLALTASGNADARGSIAEAGKVEGAKSPEAAGEAFVAALNAVTTDHALDGLVNTLAPAERRLLAFLGPVADLSKVEAQLSDVPVIEISDSVFKNRGTEDGVAPLDWSSFKVKATVSGASVEAAWADGCLSSALFSEYLQRDKICLSDDEFKGLAALGINQLSLVAVESDKGWFISLPATLANGTGVVTAKIYSLAEAGTLTPEWFEQNFSGLSSLFAGAGLGSPGSLGDLGDLGDLGTTTPDPTDPGDDTGTTDPGDEPDSSGSDRAAGALSDELTAAKVALDAYLVDNADTYWPDTTSLGEYGYDTPKDSYLAVMDYKSATDYCLAMYDMPDLTSFVQGSINASGEYFDDDLYCGAAAD